LYNTNASKNIYKPSAHFWTDSFGIKIWARFRNLAFVIDAFGFDKRRSVNVTQTIPRFENPGIKSQNRYVLTLLVLIFVQAVLNYA